MPPAKSTVPNGLSRRSDAYGDTVRPWSPDNQRPPQGRSRNGKSAGGADRQRGASTPTAGGRSRRLGAQCAEGSAGLLNSFGAGTVKRSVQSYDTQFREADYIV